MSLVVIVICNYEGLTEIIPYHSLITSRASLSQDSQSSSTDIVSSQSSSLSKSDEMFVLQKWKEWVDLLGKGSAEAQFLKEPITCSSKIIIGKSHSPFQHNDRIYLLIKINDKKEHGGKDLDDHLEPIGLLKVGRRNLFFEDDGQLVNINQCFSVLDFYVKDQRQGFGHLLFSKVIQNEIINVNQIAFDRPTDAMLSFLKKHFNLNNPIKQHNHFVIFDQFFQN